MNDKEKNDESQNLDPPKKDRNLSKILWAVFFVVSFSIFIFHSSSLLTKYLQFDTSVTVVLDGIDFILPDIYICNNNPFSKQLILNHEEKNTFYYKSIINKLFLGKTKFNFPFYVNQELEGFSKKYIFDLLSNRSFTDFNSKFKFRNRQVNIETVFDQVPHSYHSFCYKLKKEYEKHLFEAGVLEFVLFTDKFSYINETKEQPYLFKLMDGLSLTDCSHTVYVVPVGEYPHLASSKKEVEAGRKTTVKITMDYYDRVSREELTCEEESKLVKYPNYLFNTSGPLVYKATPLDCCHRLMHHDWMKECNCTWEAHPVTYEDWKTGKVKICQEDNLVEECTGYHWNKRNVGLYFPQCKDQVSCKLAVYSLQAESAPISLYTQKKYIQQYYTYRSPNTVVDEGLEQWDSTGEPPEKLLKSFAMISLHAPHHRSTIWRERFSYELKDLFSDIGGILGFYIGMSVVTFLEILRFTSKSLADWLANRNLLQCYATRTEDGQPGGETREENENDGKEIC